MVLPFLYLAWRGNERGRNISSGGFAAVLQWPQLCGGDAIVELLRGSLSQTYERMVQGFEHLITRWRQARGTRLKRQLENATLYARDLGDEQAERFGRGLNLLFNDWVERFGPLKDSEVRIRKHTVKEMRRDARRRYQDDIGAAYALEFLSYHIEASYLPGEEAEFVYDLTSYYISQAGDAARMMRNESHHDEGESDSSAF